MGLTDLECGRAQLSDLIADAQAAAADDTPAMNEIIRRFEPLTQRIAGSLTRRDFLRDDLANEARLSLVTAVRRHDARRPTFAGFAYVYMRGAALRELARWRSPAVDEPDKRPSRATEATPAPVSIGGTQLVDEIPAEPTDSPDVAAEAKLAPWGDGPIAATIELLEASQIQLLERRYLDDAPLKLIAAEAGTSTSAVSQRLRTIHRRVASALAA
jgi:RNA polymerase sigma factor (sigma-70 family)